MIYECEGTDSEKLSWFKIVNVAGKELYEQSCVACHLADGKGMKALGAPDLSDNIWLYSRDANINDIKAQILKPTNNMMPSWKQWLSPAKIKVVAAYVYSLSHK